ncbi:MAG: glycogen synthase GlgA [Candidatus Rokubacteria bacterium]|nr:glycogen synthase GlgA [Candidatus Rokubacteria bacterium]
MVPQRLRILFISPEVEPFAKTGGLADVAGALPKALAGLGHDVRVLMPKFRGVERHAGSLTPVIARLRIPVADRTQEGALLEGRMGKGPIYFLAQDHYYDRDGLYGTPEGDYWDNCERFVFFCRAAVEALRVLGWTPHVIHANDWQTGLVPVYLETLYRNDPALAKIATLFTIHNLAYQGVFWHYDMPMTGLGWDLFTPAGIEFYGKINFLKGGLVFGDLLTTVSRTYAREIQTAEFGCGLEGVLQERSRVLHGVVNGIDYDVWNPASDPAIPKGYTARDLQGKRACKLALQEELGLAQEPVPLVGLVTRLVEQKGLNLVLDALPELLANGAQLVLLGTGDPALEAAFDQAASRRKGRVAVRLGYDPALARRIYAGSDFFLMPSRYEPCGLGQLISLRYGTIPLVRWTGGLADTVTEFDPAKQTGTGFGFAPFNGEALLECLHRALTVFRQPALWARLVRNAMAEDFSWEASARQYVSLYRKALKAAVPSTRIEP